jgi:hypothetical protein
MIQRLQTLWLLFASLLAFTTLKFSFFSGNILIDNVKQFQNFTAMSNMLLMILTVVVAVGSLVSIFLYNDRKMQFKVSVLLVVVALINLILYFVATKTFIPTDWSYSLTAVLSLAIPVFLILAARAIYKDDKLVRSVDRLR